MLSTWRKLPTGRRAFGSLSLFAAAIMLLLVPTVAWAQSKTVVISQVYGAGGNQGGYFNADYVELFNLSTTNQSLDGFAIQYLSSSATTTSVTITALPAGVVLAPGQRYLIEAKTACSTTNTPVCVNLPTADFATTTLALSGSAGRVYLTNTATKLPTGSCAANVTTAVVDYVGFGASCYEGTGTAPTLTTTTAAVRTNPCTDTDDNSADFTAADTATANPRNSTSAATPCKVAVSTGITIAGTATPSSVYQGSTTLLAVTVTPGTNPASTGLTVTANLSAYGGSSSQPLYDDGKTGGDLVAGDNIYSYTLTMPNNATTGAGSIPISALDSQARSASASIAITVLQQVVLTPIHNIQGSTPGTAAYNGQTVMTTGIVTSVRGNGFFLQARDADADADVNTSEGIFVHTGTGLVPASATVGTYLQVSGTVALYPTGSLIPGTELDTPGGYTVLASNQPLPAAVTLTTANLTPSGGFAQLQKLQSMRIAIPSLTVTGPTEGVETESAETYVSDGIFWGTVAGVARPVREPGLEILDPFTVGQPTTIPRFDDNPELLRIDSLSAAGSPGAIDVSTGAVLTGVSGVLDASNPPADGSTYVPAVLIDATTRPTVTPGMTLQVVPAALSNQITIGDQNFERLYNDQKDTSGAVVVTTAAYQLRLAKASLAIRNVLRSPDILCMEEIENMGVLTDLIAKISSDALAAGQTDPLYTAYLTQGNDTSGINVAFLIKQSKITVTDVSQFGKTTMFTQPSTGNPAILNDRPPLVLHAGIKRLGNTDYPITVIVNHLKSLNNNTATTGTGQNTRAKREIQAEFLANLVQGYQANGERVIVVGDMNAFEFNDGVVDTMDIVRGIVTPANQDVVPGPSTSLVTPNLVDLETTNVPAGIYNYSYLGNAQSIEHFFATSNVASQISVAEAHYNADFPVVYRNDATRPEAGSDHDGLVGYLSVPGISVITVAPSTLTFTSQTLNTSTSQSFTVTNSGTTAITVSGAAITGSSAFTVPATVCGGSIAAGATCTIAVSFKPTVTGIVNGTLTLTDSDVTGTQTVALSGTGAGVFSTTTLLVSPVTAVSGTTISFTASVTTSGAVGSLTGTVAFLDGTTTLKSGVALSSGVATYTTTALAVGSHNITAVYSNDSLFPTSTSTPTTVTITAPPPPDFNLVISNTTIIIPPNVPSSTAVISVAMQNGYSQTVSFTCSGLPANASCSFAPASLSATGTTTLTVLVNRSTSALRSPFGMASGVMAASLLALPFAFRRKSRLAVRRAAGAMMLLLLLVGAATLSGCGSSNPVTPPSTSTVTVTATGGSVTHSSTISVVVQ